MPLTEIQLEARDDVYLKRPDPKRIWLQPRCEMENRCWCQDHPGDCEDDGCGMKAVEYVRLDVAIAGGYKVRR